ncbi:MAG: GFA family protein [Betaproteobacteria bacterium]|nr:GFA family protein [Betaproteobacteria bacterium]
MVSGKCLCGGVRFSVAETPKTVGLCHCGMCRKWCGGMPFAEFEAEVVLEKSETLRWWKSSPWGERGFCGECGTPMFWRAPGIPQWGVSAGALDSAAGMEIAKHIFIDDKADFYNFADDAPKKTGAEHTAEILSRLAAQFGEEFLRDALQKSREFHGEKFAAEVKKLTAKNAENSGNA